MEVVVEQRDLAAVVTISGDVDADSVDELRDAFDRLLAAGRHRFVVDLAGVPFMDSAGLAVMVQLLKRVRMGEGDVRLSALQPTVLRVFELVQLTRVFELFGAAEQAYASYAEPDVQTTS